VRLVLIAKTYFMKKFLLISILFSSALFAQNKIDRDHFINLLNAKKYGQVFSEALDIRQNKVYGKCAVIDYFIGKSLCLDNFPEKGKEWLESILQHYALSVSNRKFIEHETQNCQSVAFNVSQPLDIFTVPLPSAGVSGSMKGGVHYDCNSENRKMQFDSSFSEDQFESRLFGLDQQLAAVSKIRSFLTDEYEVNSRDRYILVSLKSQNITRSQVLDITVSLERAYAFYVKYFNLRPPDKIITVYLLPDEISLYKTARLVHGALLPGEVYGYSLLTDLSLLGIATPEALGTLYHELFHLIVRTDLGDIPAWLDEGLASLYSVSYWKNDTLFGNKNTWRIDQLQKKYLSATAQVVPMLVKLFSYNWQQFNGGEDVNLCQASINYALANHLMIYFQEKNALEQILNAYKKRKDPGGKNSSTAPTDTEVLKTTLGYSIDSLQSKFTQWFTNNYHFNMYLPGGGIPASQVELGVSSGINYYKNAARQMLDDLQKRSIPQEVKLEEFKKRFATIEGSYAKVERKLQREWGKWRKQHATKDDVRVGQQQMQQNAAPRAISVPPSGKTRKKMDAYQRAMDKEEARMKQLYLELKQVADKYIGQTAD